MIALVCLYHEHAHLCNPLVFDEFDLGKRHHKQSEVLLVFPDTHFVCYLDRTVMDSLIVSKVNVELEFVETALLGSLPVVGVHLFGWPAYHGDCGAYHKVHHRDLKANRVDFLGYSVMRGTGKELPVVLGTALEELEAASPRARRGFFEVREEQATCVLRRGSFAPQQPCLRRSHAVAPPGKSVGRHSDFHLQLVSCCPGNN